MPTKAILLRILINETPGSYRGHLMGPVRGVQTMQTYGDFEGISLMIVYCLGWSYNDPWLPSLKPT